MIKCKGISRMDFLQRCVLSQILKEVVDYMAGAIFQMGKNVMSEDLESRKSKHEKMLLIFLLLCIS